MVYLEAVEDLGGAISVTVSSAFTIQILKIGRRIPKNDLAMGFAMELQLPFFFHIYH